MTWIKEETLFTLLYWLSPVMTCIACTIQQCEGLYRSLDAPLLIFYSYCAKTAFSQERVMNELIFVKVYGLIIILSRVVELVIYIVIFMRQTEIESRASIACIKGDEPVSVRRHQRNVVSVMGHFVSFLLGMVHLLLPPIIYFSYFYIGESEPIMMSDFIVFIFPSLNFLVYPLVEILFSENLRMNFIEVVRWEMH